jgi:DNA-binding NarL/FixJ family response regulator
LLGAAEAFREVTDVHLPFIAGPSHEQMVAAAHTQLGEEIFARTWSEGQAMTPGQAIVAQGRSTRPVETPSAIIQPTPAYPAGLTTREVEVLRLVALGLTNIEVAEKLIISPRTVSTHLSAIFNKLGVTSRSAATRFATEHRLI